MGGVFSTRTIICGNQWPNHNTQSQPNHDLLMHKSWKTNDLLYEHVKSKRQKLENRKIESLQRTVAKFSTCKTLGCRCKGGTFERVDRDNFGCPKSICTRSGCKHPLSEHTLHLENASMAQFKILIKMVFDNMNINVTFQNIADEPKSERNIIFREVFEFVHTALNKSIRFDSFVLPNIDKMYGPPPFEKTNIDQVLLSFCMHTFKDGNILKLENALIITKFVLQYFDLWMWIIPKELMRCDSRDCSKSYDYYYRRYLMYCCLPRSVHSIPLRYRASKIFGQDVLKYTLKAFRIQLQVWCYKNNILWTEHTKLFCLNYLPIYMDLLETEVFNNKSPIWTMSNDEFAKLKRKTIFLEY